MRIRRNTWTGSDHSIRKLSGNGPTLTLGTDINASADACCLVVTITPDLRLSKHASIVSGKCFFELRKLWLVCRSLNADTTATPIHAFVTSRIDYCNCLLANAPKDWTDKRQRILNAAARVLTETNKYDLGLTRILHGDLHWAGGSRKDIVQTVPYGFQVPPWNGTYHTSQNCASQSQSLGFQHRLLCTDPVLCHLLNCSWSVYNCFVGLYRQICIILNFCRPFSPNHPQWTTYQRPFSNPAIRFSRTSSHTCSTSPSATDVFHPALKLLKSPLY